MTNYCFFSKKFLFIFFFFCNITIFELREKKKREENIHIFILSSPNLITYIIPLLHCPNNIIRTFSFYWFILLLIKFQYGLKICFNFVVKNLEMKSRRKYICIKFDCVFFFSLEKYIDNYLNI